MAWIKLNAWKKDEKQKDFTAIQGDDEHLRICPICGLVGLYAHGRKAARWVHKQERDGGMVFFTDFCEQTPDGRICSYVGGVKVTTHSE